MQAALRVLNKLGWEACSPDRWRNERGEGVISNLPDEVRDQVVATYRRRAAGQGGVQAQRADLDAAMRPAATENCSVKVMCDEAWGRH